MSERLRTSLSWFVAALVVVPFSILVVWAFADMWRAPALWPQNLSLRGFQYLSSPTGLAAAAIRNSSVVGVGATFLAVIIGWPAARALGDAEGSGRVSVLLFLAIPLLVPGYATGVGLTEWFLRLGLTDTMSGLVLVHLVYVLPYVVLIMAGAFGREVEDLEEAASTLGAGPVRRLALVTVPAVGPSLGIAALIGFVVSLSQYGTSLSVGGGIPMLPLILVPFVPTDPQVAAALSLLFLVPATTVLVLVMRRIRPSVRRVDTGPSEMLGPILRRFPWIGVERGVTLSWPLWVAVGALVFAGCSASEPAAESSSGTGLDAPIPGSEVPDVDLELHSVALDRVLFDTFDGGSVPLSTSTPALRSRLRDAIPPIDDPRYEGPEGGDWLQPDDLVLGYMAEDQAYAYPFKILNFHEIVNEDLGGVPVLISYCPLCRSGIVYDRRVGDMSLEFGNTSALYESDMVMVDRTTGSYWWQVAGEAIVGELTGTRLKPLASSVATWEKWRELHPDTRILSRDTGSSRPYEVDPFASLADQVDSGRFPFPVGDAALDDRLPPSTLVVGVEVDGEHRAYPLMNIDGVANDVIAGKPVVVFVTADGTFAEVFSPVIEERTLQFRVEGEAYVDEGTASTWTPAGRAVSGELAGTELERVPSRTTFWFAYVAAFPSVAISGP